MCSSDLPHLGNAHGGFGQSQDDRGRLFPAASIAAGSTIQTLALIGLARFNENPFDILFTDIGQGQAFTPSLEGSGKIDWRRGLGGQFVGLVLDIGQDLIPSLKKVGLVGETRPSDAASLAKEGFGCPKSPFFSRHIKKRLDGEGPTGVDDVARRRIGFDAACFQHAPFQGAC